MDKHKLGIIVPYRDRLQQLEHFLNLTVEYLDNRNYNYEIFIVEQDGYKQFNRGQLLNVGYTFAKDSNCDYVCFHDVDMLPHDVDYSYSEVPLHLATDFLLEDGEKKREFFEEYFGGVTLFPIEDFKKINGYSNKYWGWGYEDTELLFRCEVNDIPLKTIEIKNIGRPGNVIEFNGYNSYVKGKNIFNLNQNSTFFLSFNPNNFVFDHNKEGDIYTVFSIPGWDFAIFCNSFLRYSFCAFDNELKPFYVNTEIKPLYKTNMVVTVNADDKTISVYQDGILVGRTSGYKKLYQYRKEPIFYLGVGNPNRLGSENYYSGTIDMFAYYDEVLSDEIIDEISNNTRYYLNQSFGSYNAEESLKLCYDSNYINDYKLTDLSGNGNHGEIINCNVNRYRYPDYSEVKVPHRRKSTFKSLTHEENGFVDNKWKDQATRWNQLRYHNETRLNPELTKNDGLSDLKFLTHDIIKINNITHINVGL
jgi:hypothetical protein